MITTLHRSIRHIAAAGLIASCGASDTTTTNSLAGSDPTAVTTSQSTSSTMTPSPVSVAPTPEPPPTDPSPSTEPTETAPATDAVAVEPPEVTLSIDCERGTSLRDLGIAPSRVPFVDDDAPDETRWIDIETRIANPTDRRIQVDPGFKVTFLDDNGATLAEQPWIDDSDPIYRQLSTTEMTADPEQTITRRIVIFEGFSGRLVLREAHDLLFDSLDRCEINANPLVSDQPPFTPPTDIVLELDDCEPDATGSIFEATLTASNRTDTSIDLRADAEILDETGTRIAALGTNEIPLTVAAGATEEATLAGPAWQIDDLSRAAECRLYAARSAQT